ncbi:MAG: hypothetical protein E6H07_16000 [Bacteroidetes bacterium]|nr:MAG: hypothetical protein E6H07_16000 [Bacteroidota bacterium]
MDSTKTPDELKFKPPNAIPGCIYIYYNGDTNKPYPIVVFNFFDNIDSIFEGAMFLYQIDVTENELKTVKGIIEKQTLSSDIINSLIGIRTIVDGKDNWQLMKSKLRVEALFKELAESFKDKFQYNGVVSCLEYLFDRLPNR